MPYKNPEDKRRYQQKYFREYYANPEKKAQVKKRVRSRKRNLREWYLRYKESQFCSICGMSGKGNPWAIEFHHKDPEDKKDIVSGMVASGYSRKRIEAEIAKCDVICANCHRGIHYADKQILGKSLFEEVATRPQPEKDTRHGRRGRLKRRNIRKKQRKQRERDNDEKASDSDETQ